MVGSCWMTNCKRRCVELIYVLWLIAVGRRGSLHSDGQTYSLVYVLWLFVVGRRGFHCGGQTQSLSLRKCADVANRAKLCMIS
jgi:hypothetical protein